MRGACSSHDSRSKIVHAAVVTLNDLDAAAHGVTTVWNWHRVRVCVRTYDCQRVWSCVCRCWLQIDNGLIWAFIAPALIIIVVRTPLHSLFFLQCFDTVGWAIW